MSRITNIITNVRDILDDPAGTRWSDAILIRLLNTGITDFILGTECLKEKLFMELEINASTYDLSTYALKFLRVQYKSTVLLVKTHSEMDSIATDWQDHTGEPKYVIFDKLKPGYLRLYPTPDIGLNTIVQNQVYGGLVDIYVTDDIFQIPSLKDVDESMNNYIVCYIVKKHAAVSLLSLDSDLEIDIMYDRALEYYVSGHALRMGQDSLNRQFGVEQLQLYAQYMSSNIVANSTTSNSAGNRAVEYRGAFA